ncbi:MAG: delta-60 repeat domain-containing protein, partial [Limisphaerales bacterium]
APPVIEEPAEVVEAAPRRGSRRVAAAIVTVALVAILGAVAAYKFGSETSKHRGGGDTKAFRTVDTSFNPGTGANVEVRALAVQKDGKVVVGGRFTLFNEDRHVGFVRLNRDGSIDSKSVVQTDGVVWTLALQPDEKILIAGDFSNVNGEQHATVARLNPDLTIDNTFDCSSGRKGDIRAVLPANGKIFVGGPPMVFHGSKFDRLAQLDMSGNPIEGGAHVMGTVWALAMQTNGQLIVGGEFNRATGGRRQHLLRLNADGALDTNYAPNPNQRVFALALQPDGKLVVAGSFDRIDATQMRGIARLNGDGSIDKTFNPGSGADSSVQTVAVQTDGKILLGGTFQQVDGVKRNYLARLNPDGTVDQTFAPEGLSVVVRAIALAPDGNILIGGGFTNVDGVERRSIARLKAKP